MENEKNTFKKYSYTSDEAAIKGWDAFVTPIREEFNIPQYKPEPVKRDAWSTV